MAEPRFMSSPDVVCFGMITPARVVLVDRMPNWNTGAISSGSSEFVSDDAAIVAGLLTTWNLPTELIGTALGNDEAGRWTIRRLREMGVGGNFELRDGIETPFEVNVSDTLGGRTYFWDRRMPTFRPLSEPSCSMSTGTTRPTL